MIQKSCGTYIFNCDECTEFIETEMEDFHDALAYMKQEGWRVTKNADDEWIHLCSECA